MTNVVKNEIVLHPHHSNARCPPPAIHRWEVMDLTFNLAPSYQDLKHPTSRQNYYDTPGQIPKLILTLRHVLPNIPQ